MNKSRKLISLSPFIIKVSFRPDENTLSWNSEGISFFVDNSATVIICNVQKMFVGPLQSTQVTLETSEGLTTTTNFVGVVRLVLTCGVNNHHTYDFPDCVFDTESPINIISITALGAFFGKYDTMPSSDDEGNRVKSSATKSQFVWDHGKDERHFSSDQADCHSYTSTLAMYISLHFSHASLNPWLTRFNLLSLHPSRFSTRALIRYHIWTLRYTKIFYLVKMISHQNVTNLYLRTLGHYYVCHETPVPIRQHQPCLP